MGCSNAEMVEEIMIDMGRVEMTEFGERHDHAFKVHEDAFMKGLCYDLLRIDSSTVISMQPQPLNQ